jgi:cystathionine beta-lyase family protein involved in aluminum resistance
MPGYTDPVIMAAGAFTQGSSIELSADGPLRPPFTAYFQGGLTYESGKLAIMSAADAVIGGN